MAATKKKSSKSDNAAVIDRDKLRVALRRFKRDPLLEMLETRSVEKIDKRTDV